MVKKVAPTLALAFALSNSAFALNTKDLLSLVAMPLAVAAVSNVTGVPQQDLTNVVSALNQGNVPPQQFVEVVRYTPVVLTNQNTAPQFVDYVTTQVNQGVTGNALATAIADRLRTYGVRDINVTNPQFVVDDQSLLPASVFSPSYSSSSFSSSDLLALVAMPLAVDAVANLTGVRSQELMNLVSQLNQANVPPPQFIEVVRYVPVVLVDQNTAPQFVNYVTTQVNQGVTGNALANAIANQLRAYGATQINVSAPASPQVIVDQQNFVPPVVVTRVERRGRQLPPPMTSAQPAPAPVVIQQGRQNDQQGEGRGRGRGHTDQQRPVVVAPPAAAAPAPVVVQQQQQGQQGHGKGRDEGGQKGQNKDNGKQKDNGKGKGKGD
jgi:hypothetical protein